MSADNMAFLIEYAGEFYWNGRTLKKSDTERDPKLFWTNNFSQAKHIPSHDKAILIQNKFFNYPTRIVITYID